MISFLSRLSHMSAGKLAGEVCPFLFHQGNSQQEKITNLVRAEGTFYF